MADGNEKHVLILTQMASYRKQPNRMMPAIRARYRRWPKLVQALGDRHIRYNRTLEQVARQEAAEMPSSFGRRNPAASAALKKIRRSCAPCIRRAMKRQSGAGRNWNAFERMKRCAERHKKADSHIAGESAFSSVLFVAGFGTVEFKNHCVVFQFFGHNVVLRAHRPAHAQRPWPPPDVPAPVCGQAHRR